MTIVLGISCFYHDSAACLLKDGVIVAAAEEERFSRKKHDNGFPKKAVEYCLKEAEIDISQVDYVGFYEKPLLKFERMLTSFTKTYPLSLWSFFKAIPSWLTEKLRIHRLIYRKLKYKGEILFIGHHLSHAASAFLVSPFREAAILTADGVGEWTTMSYGTGRSNQINMMKEIRFPDSLGLLYSTVTAFLGFKVNNDEYKVMGLSAYGKPSYYEQFKKVIDIKEDGSFRLNPEYFSYEQKRKMFSRKFVKEFGKPRKPESRITKKHADIAATMQKITEEIILRATNHVYKVTKQKNLCIAGGVGLNSVANGRILRETPFKNIYIQPAATDAGGAVGAAAFIYHSLLKKKRSYVMNQVFLGPEFSKAEIKKYLDENKIKYKELSEKELLTTTAKLIADNKIVGWFQGRMEFGPRALGNRSILANACNPKMKDIVNKKVKHREEFRPFAPACLYEDTGKFFDISCKSPFMLLVCDVKKDKRKVVPAITHVDGSARLQTVVKEDNPLYYKLIKEFKKITGVPVVLNTSFNIRGMPIVCTPKDAYECFIGTGIDYLIMDKFLIRK